MCLIEVIVDLNFSQSIRNFKVGSHAIRHRQRRAAASASSAAARLFCVVGCRACPSITIYEMLFEYLYILCVMITDT